MGKARLKEDPKRVVDISSLSPSSMNGGYGRETLDTVKSELDSIRRLKGKLTAEIVVKEAKSKSSPLHVFFEWDNAAAAHGFRLQQARSLIRKVYVVYADGTKGRAFVHSHASAAYLPEKEIRSSDVLLATVTNGAMRELAFWCARYEHLDELEPYILKVRAVVDEWQAAHKQDEEEATVASG